MAVNPFLRFKPPKKENPFAVYRQHQGEQHDVEQESEDDDVAVSYPEIPNNSDEVVESTEAPKAKRAGKAKTAGPAGDPLDAAGSWRRADVVVTLDDGGKEKMNAGQAVDLMKSRIKAVSQLLECVRAA